MKKKRRPPSPPALRGTPKTGTPCMCEQRREGGGGTVFRRRIHRGRRSIGGLILVGVSGQNKGGKRQLFLSRKKKIVAKEVASGGAHRFRSDKKRGLVFPCKTPLLGGKNYDSICKAPLLKQGGRREGGGRHASCARTKREGLLLWAKRSEREKSSLDPSVQSARNKPIGKGKKKRGPLPLDTALERITKLSSSENENDPAQRRKENHLWRPSSA